MRSGGENSPGGPSGLWWLPPLCLVGLLCPTVAFAGDDRRPAAAAETQAAPAPRRPDFLFGRPRGSLSIRGSWLFARAGSDLFDFVTRELTIDRGDFNAPGLIADLSWTLTPRVDVQGSFDFQKASISSEYRRFVDNNQLPIEQQTSLKTIQVTASVRLALSQRGTEVSRFAWVPRRVVPYVGGGGGATRYQFLQSGDFVDFVDLSVFPDRFESSGWAPSAHALAGVDLHMHRALFGTVEARYTRSAGTLGRDFIDFDPIDLSGLTITAGIRVLF
ncbi:MAG: hypothetical protein ACT4QD_09355 [Acidobacteriota bacterium]